MQHPIGDHALLADGRTAALVDPDGNVAWLCWPRIDSAPCLLSLLDEPRGGVFAVAPSDPGAVVVERAYVPGTLVLRTTWRTCAGLLTVRDGLAWDGAPRLVRSLSASGSAVNVRVALRIAPDAAAGRATASAHGAVLHVHADPHGDAGMLDLQVSAPGTLWTVTADGTALATVTVTPGSEATLVLADAAAVAGGPSLGPTLAHFGTVVGAGPAPSQAAAAALGESVARALLRQSAVVLHGLRQRGGGIVAAPTTSLPQWPGSGRTWDYRYSWLRDTALAATGMLRAGLVDDALGLGEFIGAACAAMPPAVLLRVDGSPPPRERALEQLSGYRESRPVRIGNAAAQQPQLDVAGEVLELAAVLAAVDGLGPSLRIGAARLADWTAARWREPDHGIWEIRGRPRHYTHSRVMAWSGLRLAAGLAERGQLVGDPAAWRAASTEIRAAVLGTGSGASALTLHEGGGGPDAALAQTALVGFLEPGHPRFQATLDAIIAELDSGGLLDRHLPSSDAITDPCGPFLFPTFWLATALSRCGRDGSRYLAAGAAARGAVNLFGEVADPSTGSPLGNYPQVQSHASFVLAATDPLIPPEPPSADALGAERR